MIDNKYVIFAILFTFVGISLYAQAPAFQVLHQPNMHAGCFMENDQGVIANLSEEDDQGNPLALFRFGTEDEVWKAAPRTEKYDYVFAQGDNILYIRSKMTHPEPGTCLEYHRFKVLLKQGQKKYRYRFKGFCGC